MTRDKPISAQALTVFLEMLIASRGADLLRVKGLLNIAERPGKPAVLHGVQHVFHPVVWLDAWPSEDRRSRLVFITRDIPQATIEKLLDALDLASPDVPAGSLAPRAVPQAEPARAAAPGD